MSPAMKLAVERLQTGDRIMLTPNMRPLCRWRSGGTVPTDMLTSLRNRRLVRGRKVADGFYLFEAAKPEENGKL